MVRPDDITGAFNNQWFSGIAGAGKWAAIILISILVLIVFYYLLKLIEHKKKVSFFQVYGGDKAAFKEAIKDGVVTTEEFKRLGLQLGHPKSARLKDYKENGVRKSSIIIPSEIRTIIKPKIMKEIQFNYRYPDGLWMIRVDRNTFVPIHRPKMDENVMFHIPEPDMDLWEESANAELRIRTQDENLMRAQLYLTVGIIIGAFVLAGLIIWLSMSFAGKQINDVLVQVGPLTDSLKALAQGGSAPG